MAVKIKKAQPQETPSEQFEKAAQKVFARQRRADQRRASLETAGTTNASR